MTPSLSPRQREVLSHIANGLAVKEAARAIGIDYGTTKVHLLLARNKLGASSNAHAVALAVRGGLI